MEEEGDIFYLTPRFGAFGGYTCTGRGRGGAYYHFERRAFEFLLENIYFVKQ